MCVPITLILRRGANLALCICPFDTCMSHMHVYSYTHYHMCCYMHMHVPSHASHTSNTYSCVKSVRVHATMQL